MSERDFCRACNERASCGILRNGCQTRVPEYRALRSKRYLCTEYRYPDGSSEKELYDLARDPFELENIAGTSDPALLRQLSGELGELQRCRAESCRKAEEGRL